MPPWAHEEEDAAAAIAAVKLAPGDMDTVLAAVALYGNAFHYASEALRANVEVIVAAVRQRPTVWLVVDPSLRWHKRVATAYLQHDGLWLAHAPHRTRHSPTTVHAALAQNGLALQYACVCRRHDPETVHRAVAQNGHALRYASSLLRNDAAIVRTAVAQNGHALQHASPLLRNRRAVVLLAVTSVGGDTASSRSGVDDRPCLAHASARLRADYAVVRAAVHHAPDALDAALGDAAADPYLASWRGLTPCARRLRKWRDAVRTRRVACYWYWHAVEARAGSAERARIDDARKGILFREEGGADPLQQPPS